MTAPTLPPTDAAEPTLPARAQRWIAVVAMAGLAIALLTVRSLVETPPDGVDVWTVVLLTGLSTGSVIAPLRFHHGGDVQGFNLTTGVFLALLVVADVEVALLATLVAAAVGYAIGTRSVVKTAFDVGQEALWAVAAVGVARLVMTGPLVGDVLAPRRLVAVVVAAAVGVAVNVVVMGELFHRLRGEPRVVLMREVLGVVTVVYFAGNTLVALLLAVLADRSPVAVLLAAPLLVAVLVGYRGHAAAQETARMTGVLQRTSSSLVEAALDEAALQTAVAGLQELFGADTALLDNGGERPAGPLREVLDTVRRTGVPVLDDVADGCMAVPVVLDGRVVGALAVAGRRGVDGWDQADVALLGTVAGEVAATLRARQLLRQLEQERTALQTETSKLGDILQTASDGIVLLDGEGRVRACNPAMAAIADITVDEALGQRWDRLLRLEDEEGASLSGEHPSPLARALAGVGAVEAASVRLVRPGGEQRWLRCSAAPVLRDGVPDGVVLVAVDLTAEHEVEELRNDFVATVSHELRTPLTPLRGFLAVLTEHGAVLERDRLEVIHAAMDKQLSRLEDLIGDLLLVAELERGLSSVTVEPIALAPVIEAVVDVEAAGPALRHRIVVDLAPELTAGTAAPLADAACVRRIVRSLVSNGLKHTTASVRVLATVDGTDVVVAVEDDGEGIATESRELIFAPFRRLGNHLHRTQGPGLGLAIARSMAEASGGSLTVVDAASGGARFELRLPLAGAAATELSARRADHRVGRDRG